MGAPRPWCRQASVVEVNHVLVDHANATGGNVLADGPWLVRAMDPVEGVFVFLPQIKSAGTEWIVRSAGHSQAALQFSHSWSELGPALEDLVGRIGVRNSLTKYSLLASSFLRIFRFECAHSRSPPRTRDMVQPSRYERPACSEQAGKI